jgi:hypothetical protein
VWQWQWQWQQDRDPRFFHANSNVLLFIRSFYLSIYLLLAIFSGRNWSFRVRTKKRVLESTNGTLPAAVNAFYLSGQQCENVTQPFFPSFTTPDLRNFSDGHQKYDTSMIRLRLCSSYSTVLFTSNLTLSSAQQDRMEKPVFRLAAFAFIDPIRFIFPGHASPHPFS